MYIPALQARQAERGAVTRIAEKINESGLCTPFFMPVTSKLNDVSLVVRQMSAASIRYFLLTTPLSEYAGYSQSEILNVLDRDDENSCAIPTVCINGEVSEAAFKGALKAVKSRDFAIYHDAEAEDVKATQAIMNSLKASPRWHLFRGDTCTNDYMKSWNGDRFYISDDFTRRARNQDYADRDDELYSNQINEAYARGFNGFGDFTITGDFFSPTGGRAGAVTIHFSYPRGKDGVWIRHFVSENTDRNDAPAPKFIDAAGQLLDYVASSRTSFSFSSALAELRAQHEAGHFPGLPALKRIAVQHHIELMIHLLSKKP